MPIRRGSFFKILKGELVLTLVLRTRRYLDEPQRLQLAAHRCFVNRNLELLEKPKRQILAAPTHNTVDRRDWTIFHKSGKRLALVVVQFGRLARRLAINQPRRAVRVKPQNPIPDHLQTNRPDPRRIQTLAAIVNLLETLNLSISEP